MEEMEINKLNGYSVPQPSLLYITLFQGYHGLSKDDDRLWAMEIDREHSRGGGVLHHAHTAAHPPLGWTGLVETLPPPPGALPLPPPPHNSLAGDPNGHPPPGNSGTPVSTGHSQVSQENPGQARAGSLLADLLVQLNMVSIILQLGTAVPGAEVAPAQPLVPPAGPARRPPPPPPSTSQGPAPGSGGLQTHQRSGLSPTLLGNLQELSHQAALISMVTISLLTVMTRGRPLVGSGDPAYSPPTTQYKSHLSNQITNQQPADQSGPRQHELLSQVGPAHTEPVHQTSGLISWISPAKSDLMKFYIGKAKMKTFK